VLWLTVGLEEEQRMPPPEPSIVLLAMTGLEDEQEMQ
jgi:hypothetical protein